MIGIIISIISGALMSIQGVFNTGITKQTNIWLTNSFVQLTAFLVCIGAWIFTGRQSSVSELFKVDNKYMLLGGVIGAFITFTVIKGMDSLGPAKAVMIIVISQLLVAYFIEVFGLFGTEKIPFEIKKLVGLLLAVTGIVVFKWE
ncbi:DMT family transporter [Eubacteriales bacterium OttesenSCG-928-G02]|nr:DMT family transporter [Eubacteriales bacterium OttesenSCG-928-G02]